MCSLHRLSLPYDFATVQAVLATLSIDIDIDLLSKRSKVKFTMIVIYVYYLD